MLKKTITYTDYDGNQRTEDLYFNLSRAEVIEMDLSTTGGMQKLLERIVAEQDSRKITEIFKELILKAYGEKSPDGKRFIKSRELSEAFSQTEAYSELFVELLSDAEKAAAFFTGILPPVPPEELEKAKAQLPPSVSAAIPETK